MIGFDGLLIILFYVGIGNVMFCRRWVEEREAGTLPDLDNISCVIAWTICIVSWPLIILARRSA